MMRDGNKMVSAIFKDKKNADKFNRNNSADVKKLLQLAKKTKFPKAIDEDTDVGHQDDEPNMLKSTALEIMEYGKKLMDKLDKYDDMEDEVDFPNWWQSKLTLAKDYVQKAYHYLDSEEKTSENIDRNFRTYADDEGDDEGPVDEAYLVAYGKREGNKTIKPAFAAYADKKMAQKFMADMKKDGYKVMMTQKKIRGIDEGKKRYNVMYGVGSSKYTVNFHDGKSKHKDGSDFFDIAIFKNKKDLAKKINDLTKKGYIYSYKEGVNEDDMVFDPKTKRFKIKSGSMDWEKNFKWANDKELKVISKFIFMNPQGISGVIKMSKHKPFAFRRTIQKMAKKGLHEASKEAMGIAGFTGTRGVAVDDFIKKNKIDARKLFNFVKKGNLRDRMDFVAAIAGRPNNKMFKMITKKFGESVNEGILSIPKSELTYQLSIDYTGRSKPKITTLNRRFIEIMYGYKINPNDVIKSLKKVSPDTEFKHMKWSPKSSGGGHHRFAIKESVNEDKNQIVKLKKKVGKSEIKFYDALSKIEKKLGKKKYRAFLEKGLKDFKINAKHYDYRSNGAAEEKLFQLAK